VSVEGASARLTNNTLQSNLSGIEVHSTGNARIGINDDGSAGLGNTIEENINEGIKIWNGASAYMLNNSIRLNGSAGVSIGLASGRLLGGNTIEKNGGDGVTVVQGDLFQGIGGWNFPAVPRDIISNNDYCGISVSNGAHLDIQSATITNNIHHGIVLSLQSTLRIYDSAVSSNSKHGILLIGGSSVDFGHPTGTPPVSITNHTNGFGVQCDCAESRYTGDTSQVTGNLWGDVSSSCTIFCPPVNTP
jgi:hypothetical protein